MKKRQLIVVGFLCGFLSLSSFYAYSQDDAKLDKKTLSIISETLDTLEKEIGEDSQGEKNDIDQTQVLREETGRNAEGVREKDIIQKTEGQEQDPSQNFIKKENVLKDQTGDARKKEVEPNLDLKTSGIQLQETKNLRNKPLERTEGISAKNVLIKDFTVDGVDVKDALGLLSLQSGLEIIFDKNIKNNLSFSLVDVKAIDALRVILHISDLAYNEENGKIHILSLEEFKQKFGHPYEDSLETAIVTLKNISFSDIYLALNKMKSESGKIFNDKKSNRLILMDAPGNVEAMVDFIADQDVNFETEIFPLPEKNSFSLVEEVKALLTKDKGRVTFDERSNSLVVTDTFLKVKEIEEFLKKRDHSKIKIKLSTKMLEVNLFEEHISGVDWEAIVTNYKSIPFPSLINERMKGNLRVGTLSAEDYEILLDALDAVGDIEDVMDSETILTNNQISKLNFDLVIKAPLENKEGSEAVVDNEQFQLSLTPSVHKENILLSFSPSLNRNISLNTSSDIEFENGSTVVIGGMFKEITVERKKSFPFLGKVPLIKNVFVRRKRNNEKLEFVVFLTFNLQE